MAKSAAPVFTTPPPNTIMPTAAPKAAPCETPSVEAEASGLCSTHCITAPDMASAAPTSIAAAARGKRMPKSTVFAVASPRPISARNISSSPNSMLPVPASASAAIIASAQVMRRASSFFLCSPS